MRDLSGRRAQKQRRRAVRAADDADRRGNAYGGGEGIGDGGVPGRIAALAVEDAELLVAQLGLKRISHDMKMPGSDHAVVGEWLAAQLVRAVFRDAQSVPLARARIGYRKLLSGGGDREMPAGDARRPRRQGQLQGFQLMHRRGCPGKGNALKAPRERPVQPVMLHKPLSLRLVWQAVVWMAVLWQPTGDIAAACT